MNIELTYKQYFYKKAKNELYKNILHQMRNHEGKQIGYIINKELFITQDKSAILKDIKNVAINNNLGLHMLYPGKKSLIPISYYRRQDYLDVDIDKQGIIKWIHIIDMQSHEVLSLDDENRVKNYF